MMRRSRASACRGTGSLVRGDGAARSSVTFGFRLSKVPMIRTSTHERYDALTSESADGALSAVTDAPPPASSPGSSPGSSPAEVQRRLADAGVRYFFGTYTDIHGVPKSKCVPIA